MEINSNAINQFVKATTVKEETKADSPVLYGTAVVQDDGVYVKIDGTESVTPATAAVDVRGGDRVQVSIKDHNAEIVANYTQPASGYGASETKTEIEKTNEYIRLYAQGNDENLNKIRSSININKESINSTVQGLKENIDGEFEEVKSEINQTKESIKNIVESAESASIFHQTDDGFEWIIDGDTVVTEYCLSASKTNAPTSGWSESVPTWNYLKTHLWTREKTTKKDGSSSYSDPELDQYWESSTNAYENGDWAYEHASQVATNYMSFNKNEGLVIADRTTKDAYGNPIIGKNVRIDNDGVDIRDDKTTLATFSKDGMQLNFDNNDISAMFGKADIAGAKTAYVRAKNIVMSSSENLLGITNRSYPRVTLTSSTANIQTSTAGLSLSNSSSILDCDDLTISGDNSLKLEGSTITFGKNVYTTYTVNNKSNFRSAIDAASSSHNHSGKYLPVSSPDADGKFTATGKITAYNTKGKYPVSLGNGSSDNPTRRGVFDENTSQWILLYTGGSSLLSVPKSSSRKIKENIRPMTEDEANALLTIEVVDFDYKERYGGAKNCQGVIAEDVKEVVPQAYVDSVSEKEEIPGIDYASFIPRIIKLCQIQQRQIDELKERIKILEF